MPLATDPLSPETMSDSTLPCGRTSSRPLFSLKTVSRLLTVASLMTAAASAWAAPLRICADPDNLPFSKSEGAQRGLYVDAAELIGRELKRPVEYVWWQTFNQRRALRNTILANACDAVIALPATAEYKVRGVKKSQPFMELTYALVAPPSFRFESMEDLRGKQVGVLFGTTPHIFVNTAEGVRSTTFRTSDELLQALSRGEIEAALLWGPVAGYENKSRFDSRWKVTPIAGPDFASQVVIGVRSDQPNLAAEIDRALVTLKPQLATLAQQYGFPTGPAIALDPKWREPVPVAVAPATVVATAPTAQPVSDDAAARAGRVRFNSQCSHCHGTDSVTALRERDLRRLKSRNDDRWPEVALTTIREGRPEKGMPTWKDALKEDQIQEIISFLRTIQK